MTEPPEDRQAALDQLRAWRASFDRRDPLIYAAHLAGASLNEIREASGVAINTARTAITAQEAAMQTTAVDPLAQYHHPHFVGVEEVRPDEFRFTFRAFTGSEPQPEMPAAVFDDKDISYEAKQPLSREYEAARKLWGTSRFHRDARPVVDEMVQLLAAYQQARDAMTEAYTALLATGDNSWRAQIMQLTGCHEEARTAAEAWDSAVSRLFSLYEDHRSVVGFYEADTVENLISTYGHDTSGWELGIVEDYQRPGYYGSDFQTPAVKETAAAIDQQRARIRDVADLTREPSTD